jgi:ribosomal protein S21
MSSKKKKSGVGIDLQESKMSVEQALRELKNIMADDIEMLKEKKYYEKPSRVKREREKKRKANIRKYSRN